jgi:hypothetical protein
LPDTLHALCTCTRVIGAGNSFEILIPLSEISDYGQTYRVLRPDHDNREFVPFELGIEPYISDINLMEQGFARYDRWLAHERASKPLKLAILQRAFPENRLTEVPFLWNDDYLPDRQVTLTIDRAGNLVDEPKPAIARPRRPRKAPAP